MTIRNLWKFIILSLFLCNSLLGSCFADSTEEQKNQQNYLTVGIIPSGSSSPFHKELLKSFNQSAQNLLWRTIILTPDYETNISFQKKSLRKLINEGVDMIALNTLNPTSLKEEIHEANSAGIPVLFYNTLTPVKGLNITEYIGYNQYRGAAEMGFYASRLLTDKRNDAAETIQGNVFILRGLPGFHANQRTSGFISGLSQSPGIKVIGEEIAEWDRDKARVIGLNILSKKRDIDIFFGNSDEMAIGAAIASTEKGKTVNTDIFCIGIDGNNPTLEMITNGTMTATLGVYPDKMGEIIIEQMQKLQNGQPIPLFLETPVTVVDRDTVDAYMNGSLWTGAFESEGENA